MENGLKIQFTVAPQQYSKMTMPTTELPLENALIVGPSSDSTESTQDNNKEPTPKHDGNNNNNNNNNCNTTTLTTPKRPSAYSADPMHTPIASAKRPGALSSKSASRSYRSLDDNDTATNSGTTRTNNNNTAAVDELLQQQPLSPMHGVRTVENTAEAHRGIVLVRDHPPHSSSAQQQQPDDQLFSPVAHVPDHNSSFSVADSSDDDESMGRPEQPDYSNNNNSDEFNPWQFIQALPPYRTVAHQRPAITLPALPDATKKTLVLDLDETLVHCSIEAPAAEGADLHFPVTFHGMQYTVYVRLRPHLHQFLETVARHFEVVCFTASQKVYADALLDRIDPERKLIHHRLFRDACLCVEGNFLKDLNVLGRDLSRTVLVDNSPHAFGYQVDNGIPIESWFDCPEDTELLKLARFLQRQVLPATDVREVVRKKFESQVLVDQAPPLLQY